MLIELKKQNENFAQHKLVIDEIEIQLEELIAKPVLRFTQYLKQIKQLYKTTLNSHPDKHELNYAVTRLKDFEKSSFLRKCYSNHKS